jgi:hypothetical protein
MSNSPGGSKLPSVRDLNVPSDRSILSVSSHIRCKVHVFHCSLQLLLYTHCEEGIFLVIHTEIVHATTRAGICHSSNHNVTSAWVGLATAVVGDLNLATTEAGNIPGGRQRDDKIVVTVELTAGASHTVLGVEGRMAEVAVVHNPMLASLSCVLHRGVLWSVW